MSFNAEMARLARHSRGFTQGAVAKSARIGQGKISKLESGVIDPSADELARLADALHYPTSFFERDWIYEGPGVHELHHRKRKKVPTSRLKKIYANLSVQKSHVQILLNSVCDVDHEFLVLPAEEFDGDAAKIARTIRAVMRIPMGPVHDLTGAVERVGGIVICAEFETRFVDGISLWTKSGPPAFWINRDIPPDRWRWTLAHELGHIVMHAGGDVRVDTEDEADTFAGEFLMPEAEIKPHLANLTISKLAGLKQRWKVSMQALVMRAYKLGMISNRKRRFMFMELGKAGYRMREPSELDPPIERPKRLANILDFHEKTLGYTVSDMEKALSVYWSDIHKLAPEETSTIRVIK